MAAEKQAPAIITLTTDFGMGSRYIGAMKGVILSINPAAQIIDLSHSVPARDVRAGAIVLAKVWGQSCSDCGNLKFRALEQRF